MNKKDLFLRLSKLPEEVAHVEYLKLSDEDKGAYENYLKAEAGYYREATIDVMKEVRKLEMELKQEKSKYNKLKNKIN